MKRGGRIAIITLPIPVLSNSRVLLYPSEVAKMVFNPKLDGLLRDITGWGGAIQPPSLFENCTWYSKYLYII